MENQGEYTDSRKYFVVRMFGMKPVTLPVGKRFDVAGGIGIGTSLDGMTANSRSAANALECKLLYDRGVVPNILLVGGARKEHIPGSVTEAEGMCRFLESLPAKKPYRLQLETLSKNTIANAEHMKEIMLACGWKSAVICAEALHAGRVSASFAQVWAGSGLEFIVVPTYGLYDDAADWKETPTGFLAFNTIATIITKHPTLHNYLKKRMGRA